MSGMWGILQGSGPQPFWYQRPVSWKTVFPRTRVGWRRVWFQDDSSVLHLLCTLFLLLLHQLHLRSSGIRSQRLGTPALEEPLTECSGGSPGTAQSPLESSAGNAQDPTDHRPRCCEVLGPSLPPCLMASGSPSSPGPHWPGLLLLARLRFWKALILSSGAVLSSDSVDSCSRLR